MRRQKRPDDFSRFSAQLFCSGAMEQRCVPGVNVSTSPGTCLWYKPSSRPVREADMNRSLGERHAEAIVKRWPTDRWDPAAAGVPGFRYFGPAASEACVRGKRVMIAGDSTTRDTFYEFALVAGRPMWSQRVYERRGSYWPEGQYEPHTPTSSGGADIRGACIGNYDKRKMCWRDESFAGGATRLGFQFLTRANSSWELDRVREGLSERAADVVFVQCPIYEYFKPDAYDYSLSKEARHRLANEKMGPHHLQAMGSACLEYIDMVRSTSPKAQIFLLGITPLPAWTRTIGGDDVESKIFKSINTALGIRCRRRATDDRRPEKAIGSRPGGASDWTYALSTQRSVTPIDRYAIVGPRRRDMIHPFFNAQFAIVQMMLNHMCPS
ncbi:hypothetical protein AB1Y20_000177 [Prymnesium parvum]|uniref:SGNH domain-containing protein n=1 Tax=Prymnesium parvum TaxID=97485 RepID=A0AB34K742_PRYPA